MKTLFVALCLAAAAAIAPAAAVTRNLTAIVDVIAFNDVYEMLQDSVNGLNLGGPSRVVKIAKDMRCKNPNSLVLFAGDTMSPSLWSAQFHGMQMVDAHNAIGVDFASLGNHEFDFGVEGFLNVSQASKFLWLNANYFEASTKQLLRGTVPNAIKSFSDRKFGKITIGFFGVIRKEQVKLLKAQKADFIIALTHQDLADDNRFSKEVTGVNLIYGGHDHTSQLEANFGAPYLKADFDFRSIWVSHLEYFAASGSLAAYTRMTHHSVPIIEALSTDPGLEKVITAYALKVSELTSRVIGVLYAPLGLTKNVVRGKDIAIGAIFLDSCLPFYGDGSAGVAVRNDGDIRTDMVYPDGPITMEQVIVWSTFRNTLVVIETDGASLKKYVAREMLASCGDKATLSNGLYMHPAGFKYTFECTGKGVGEITGIEWLKHPTRYGPLLDTDVFKLALSNFLYTSEFFVTSGAVVKKVVVSEAEASRIDSALELYAKSFPDSNMCVVAEERSQVLATYPPSS